MSIESYILDGEGNPVAEPDTLKWGKWMQDAERRVAFDQVTPQVRVSTVFLGLNHSFGGDIPVLYETMIFGGPNDQYQNRYATREAALEGHKHAVSIALIKQPD